MAIASPAQVFTVIKRFNGTKGADPASPPVEGYDLNLYGTAITLGANSSGTLYRLTPAGALGVLHNFCGISGCPDGVFPNGTVLGSDGLLYGTTAEGGTTSGGMTNGGGTVFSIATNGKLTTLYSFCAVAGCPDGLLPRSGLVEDNYGYLYGTTANTVFKIAIGGGLTTLHTFSGADGGNPLGVLVLGVDGNLYGTTSSGGAHGQGGTVFQISPTGTLTTLYSFCASTFSGSCPDGDTPVAGVVQGADGNFYGTTLRGGNPANCTSGCGTIFKLAPQGILTTLFSPSFPSTQGEQPDGLMLATDGNFYGTTAQGGAHGNGAVFQITPSGTFTLLHSLSQSDGINPQGGLTQKTDGNFYGTAYYGGNPSSSTCPSCGTVFRLSMGLAPFVKFAPAGAKVGYTVGIYGSNLTGTSSVTFNGIPSTFVAVQTSTLIYVTVPAGATTGPIQVTTPSGVLTSNGSFQVLP